MYLYFKICINIYCMNIIDEIGFESWKDGKKRKDYICFCYYPFSFLVIKWREVDEDVLEKVYNKEFFHMRNIYSCNILWQRLSLILLVIFETCEFWVMHISLHSAN